ncbi:unnamed protein product [Arabis nemorensis]|uniref:NTF2 domain-containing protein n=1 Tax=Arabis nemorensis TaxID=586526 RepID=A0A565AYU7_9BRAS|nr:unnamed protein product [Arabis nemorensis]
MATEEGVPSAHDYASAFVEQYYHIIGQLPQEAFRFYVDASVVSRPRPDGTMMSFTSVEAINKEFLSYDYENTTYEVLSVDSHNSVENGIFIMVIGFLTGKDNLERTFSQMFYLARQDSAYVVLNDIFRFVDNKASAPITLPVAESVPATEMAKPAGGLNKTEPIHKTDVNAVEKTVNAAEAKNVVAGPLDNGNIKQSDEKVVTAENPKEPVVDGAKRSFADIVQSMAKSAAPFQVKPQVKSPAVNKPKPRAAAALRAPNSEKKNVHKIIDEPGTSIFVSNLPMTAMPPQLHELFKDFGPIKENGIQIRSSRASGICFGFVAFESTTSVQSVLQAAKKNPFMLADLDYDGSKPSGKTGGGSKTQNGPTDGSKTQNGPADGSKTENGSEDGSKAENVSEDGSKAENGSADGGDGFVLAERKRRNRNRKNGGRTERSNGNGDNNYKRSSEGRAAV